MPQFNNKISQIPTDYPYRYTLDFHIRVLAARRGIGIMDIMAEILALLEVGQVGMTGRQLYRYRIEAKDSTKEELSEERKEIIGEYLELDNTDELVTSNILLPT